MPRWNHIETIKVRLAAEVGTIHKPAARRVALCYPSPYHVGMSSLGFQTIYREINRRPDVAAERAFLPDDVAEWRESRLPLVTYESQLPVSEFEIVAFSISFELEITGLFEMLQLSDLPVLASERDASHPLVVAGGPLTFSNPVTLLPFVDVLLLGEGEELVHSMLDAWEGAEDRERLLDRLAELPGI
ncbi:MAG: radical SAM protein, partial [Acidobacteria bacterium]|nr:radical SAM protein [Acidobacteriota bacterium]